MKVADAVIEMGLSCIGECGYSDIGAVVGATYPEELAEIRKRLPNITFLVPGYGAQGGTADDVRGAFNSDGYGAAVSTSRGVNFAYEKQAAAGQTLSMQDIVSSMQRAAQKAKEDILRVTPSI